MLKRVTETGKYNPLLISEEGDKDEENDISLSILPTP